MVDHQKLLKKYLHHVQNCEGCDYVDTYQRHISDAEFTDEEWAELKKISGEVYCE